MRFFLLLLFSLIISNAQAEVSAFGIESTQQTEEIKEPEEIEKLEAPEAPEEVVKEEIQAKLLYQSYYELPKKLFKGQVFTLTIKALSAKKDYESLDYSFSNETGLTLLSDERERKINAPYFYDTFYFQVTGDHVRVPDVQTSLIFNNNSGSLEETLRGERINTVRLNPDQDFSQVLAENFKILEYKTTQYDNQHNIVVFSAEAKMANLNDFSLKAASKEGIDAYEQELPYSNFTYYAVVSKQLNELKFTYFNLGTRRFQDVVIPIIVINDRVSTQTDLAPTQNTHVFAKIIAAGLVSAIGIILFIYRRNKFYLLIIILPLFFIAKLSVPIKHVCVKEDSNIYLLPMKNGTIFEKVPFRFTTESLGEAEDFTKIRMQNNQIGWVQDENLCKD
jgi:hypothetical protein